VRKSPSPIRVPEKQEEEGENCSGSKKRFPAKHLWPWGGRIPGGALEIREITMVRSRQQQRMRRIYYSRLIDKNRDATHNGRKWERRLEKKGEKKKKERPNRRVMSRRLGG